jgi:uncharacterized membrane protein
MVSSARVSKWNARIDSVLHRTITALAATVWLSAVLFALYIVLFYLNTYMAGDLARWNQGRSELYVADAPVATAGIGLHFLSGAVILLLGSIQLIERFRNRFPQVHRWIGRVYIVASLITAIGGLVYIFLHGTVGGTVMDIGFTLYGILMFAAAIETLRHARAGRMREHRAWALRLYVLAIGSWLYRMEYGVWFLFTGGVGSTENLNGPFDQVMAFFFYLPNLAILELILRLPDYHGGGPVVLKRARTTGSLTVGLTHSTTVKAVAAAGLLAVTGMVVLMTLAFVFEVWGPAIWGGQ